MGAAANVTQVVSVEDVGTGDAEVGDERGLEPSGDFGAIRG